jgi:hypothetical protein
MITPIVFLPGSIVPLPVTDPAALVAADEAADVALEAAEVAALVAALVADPLLLLPHAAAASASAATTGSTVSLLSLRKARSSSPKYAPNGRLAHPDAQLVYQSIGSNLLECQDEFHPHKQ